MKKCLVFLGIYAVFFILWAVVGMRLLFEIIFGPLAGEMIRDDGAFKFLPSSISSFLSFSFALFASWFLFGQLLSSFKADKNWMFLKIPFFIYLFKMMFVLATNSNTPLSNSLEFPMLRTLFVYGGAWCLAPFVLLSASHIKKKKAYCYLIILAIFDVIWMVFAEFIRVNSSQDIYDQHDAFLMLLINALVIVLYFGSISLLFKFARRPKSFIDWQRLNLTIHQVILIFLAALGLPSALLLLMFM